MVTIDRDDILVAVRNIEHDTGGKVDHWEVEVTEAGNHFALATILVATGHRYITIPYRGCKRETFTERRPL